MAHPQDDTDATTPPTTLLMGPLVWTSERHSILVNGLKVAIKGINWFGFGTSMRTWEGGRRMSFCLSSLGWGEAGGGILASYVYGQQQ
jgi:hypothetical protein